MSTLEIRDLQVSVKLPEGELKPILAGVDLTVKAGETHAIMGPNGSGKSTLAYSIAGHPKYQITGGSVTLDGDDVLAMTVDERARAGLFLAMQYPVEVPGVSVANFLRTAKTAIDGEAPKLRTWAGDLRGAMEKLQMDPAFAQRNVNEGFSGGEKKRHEIMQLELLKPKMAILDETDSGLDIDALRIVSEGVNRVRETGDTGLLLITHYTRILRYIKPDFVHVFVGRQDRPGGRPGARRAARGRGLRALRRRDGLRSSDLHDVRRGPLRKDFPILDREINGHPLVYLDSANTSQKPGRCWTRMREHYERHNGNVSRSVHTLGTEADVGVRGGARRRWRRSSAPPRPTRSSSPRTPPRRSTWSRTRPGEFLRLAARATRS